MRLIDVNWRRAAARLAKWLGYGAAVGCFGVALLGDSAALAQRGRGRGNGNGGGGVRVQGGGNAGVRMPTVQSGQVRVPSGGGQVRIPAASGQVRLPEVRSPGAAVRVPPAGGEIHVPSAAGQVRAPGAGANVRIPGAGADVRVPPAGASARLPSTGGDIRTGADIRTGDARTTLRPNLDADGRGGARIDGSATAHVPGGVRIDPSVASRTDQRLSPSWARVTGQQRVQLDQFRNNLNSAMKAQVRSDAAAAANAGARVNTSQWLSAHPNRAQIWNNWATNARSGFTFGANPFFNYNWWNTRSLIGLGLGGYGYGMGPGYGGWWGYQPWLGYRPWSYWYGNPGWGGLLGMFSGYGWNQPYYYDYGPGGNVVYSGNQVLVNSQPVGTPVEYAQSAAELAYVDPATIGQTRPEDWMALGTYTLSTAQDDRDPARVIQLATNKDGLISGTMFNKNTGKTYTVQGRVDKETQRVAFTLGNTTDLVLETGLYNLTQDQTPVLAHLGPSQTTTYLLARLPEPQHEPDDGVRTATAPPPPTLP